jgi:hypothetical protein
MPIQNPKSEIQNPEVGIFWWYDGQLLASSWAIAEGEAAGDWVNGREDHITFWPVLQRQLPKIRSIEYEDVPRGRVIYCRSTRVFQVYMDARLFTRPVKRAIRVRFGLAAAKVRFGKDPHYTTDPNAIERLFES